MCIRHGVTLLWNILQWQQVRQEHQCPHDKIQSSSSGAPAPSQSAFASSLAVAPFKLQMATTWNKLDYPESPNEVPCECILCFSHQAKFFSFQGLFRIFFLGTTSLTILPSPHALSPISPWVSCPSSESLYHLATALVILNFSQQFTCLCPPRFPDPSLVLGIHSPSSLSTCSKSLSGCQKLQIVLNPRYERSDN